MILKDNTNLKSTCIKLQVDFYKKIIMNKVYIVFVFIFFISCQNKPTPLSEITKMDVDADVSNVKNITIDSSDAITLSVKDAEESYDVGEFIDSIEYIPLETRDDVLIGRISKVILHNNKFYLLDSSVAKSIFIFNKEGKHLNTISTLGRGPNEYLSPKNITIDKYNNELILIDNSSSSLLYYDLDGNFKRKERCGVRFEDILRITKENFLMHTGFYENLQISKLHGYKILIGSPLGELKWKGFLKDKFYNSMGFSGIRYIHECGKNILVTFPFTNTIHQINPDGTALLRYHFVFKNGSPELYKNLSDTGNDLDINVRRSGMDYYVGDYLAETDNHLITTIEKAGIIQYFIYDINTKKSFVAIGMDPFGKVIGGVLPCFTDGNSVYSLLDPSDIQRKKNAIKEGDTPPKGWELPKVLENVKETDNPVIIRYTLRTE